MSGLSSCCKRADSGHRASLERLVGRASLSTNPVPADRARWVNAELNLYGIWRCTLERAESRRKALLRSLKIAK